MAAGVPLTPDEAATIVRVFHETGNASEAARQAGVSEGAARSVLRKARETTRHELHARALARAERSYRRALVANLTRLETELEGAETPKDLVEVSKAMHDGLRTLSQVRTAHAKVTGDHAAEKHELTGANGSPLTIYAPPEREP